MHQADAGGGGSAQPLTDGPRIGVLVADAHEVFAQALALAIEAHSDLSCAGVATTASEALALADRTRPGAAVVDLRLRDGDGIALTRQITARFPDLRVLILTGLAPSASLVAESVDAGASGFLPKIVSLDAVVASIRQLSDKSFVLDPETVRSLCNRGRDGHDSTDRVPTALTQRERDMLELLTSGVDPQAASVRLGITVNTARGYVKSLYGKLGVHNQLELLAVARRRGLLEEAESRAMPGADPPSPLPTA
jgi:DNA-binding NarL/FixJ family response regulator